jgi:transposase InsO family protein
VQRKSTESFFASLRKELTNRVDFVSRDTVRSNAFEDIEAFYNRMRRHSTINYQSRHSHAAEKKLSCHARRSMKSMVCCRLACR